MKHIKKRLTNRVTLVALGAQFLVLLGLCYFYVTGEPIPDGLVDDLILGGGAVVVILTTLGVLNNPDTDNKGLKDDPKNFRKY